MKDERIELTVEERMADLKQAFSKDLEKPKSIEILLLDLDEEIDRFFLSECIVKPQDRYIYKGFLQNA